VEGGELEVLRGATRLLFLLPMYRLALQRGADGL
jgi:hypothetical protein